MPRDRVPSCAGRHTSRVAAGRRCILVVVANDETAGAAKAAHELWYGNKHLPPEADLEPAWKAVKIVAMGDGKLSDAEHRALVGKMHALHTPSSVIAAVLAYEPRGESPARLLAKLTTSAEARASLGAWIVYEALSVALGDGELAVGELDAVQKIAATMDVRSAVVDVLAAIVRDEAALRERRVGALRGNVSSSLPGG